MVPTTYTRAIKLENNMLDFKKINIGFLIETKWKEREISLERTCNFINCSEEDVEKVFTSKSLDSAQLLRWSKLLQYDFFRIYTQHLILFSPLAAENENKIIRSTSTLPEFRKNIYTKELIDFVIELIEKGEKTKFQIIEEYSIPKTTVYKWIKKYNTLKT